MESVALERCGKRNVKRNGEKEMQNHLQIFHLVFLCIFHMQFLWREILICGLPGSCDSLRLFLSLCMVPVPQDPSADQLCDLMAPPHDKRGGTKALLQSELGSPSALHVPGPRLE